MKLNQVTLPALDIAASVAFYRALGFLQIVDAPHYARFDSGEGGASFSVHRVDEAGGEAVRAALANPTVVYFELPDAATLDATVERLQALGIAFEQAPRDEQWLWREARLKDPAGNELCLYHAGANRLHPPWRMLPVF